MSRVAKSKMAIPATVEIQEKDGIVTIKSKANRNAVCEYTLPKGFAISMADNQLSVVANEDVQENMAIWGTTTRNIFNRVKGVDKAFTQNVNLVGVGYKCQVQGKRMTFDLGFSHRVEFDLPAEVDCSVERNTALTFTSFDKEKLGQTIGNIIKIRPPEPYKGKGVIKEGAILVRKEGKKKNG
jgi:large subunit ribosomal protein L6